jgi:hypothetical protein
MTEAPVRRSSAEEDPRRVADRSVLLQVEGERPSNVGEERQAVVDQALAANHDFALAPMKIAELEGEHLAGAKAKLGEKEEDGVVPPSRRGRAVTATQKPRDIARR